MNTCWYCQAKPSHPSADVVVVLRKDVGQEFVGIPGVLGSRKTYYRLQEVKIPRCQDCQSAHQAEATGVFNFLVGGIALGSGIGAGLGIGALLHVTWLSVVLGITVGLAMGFIVAILYYRRKPQLKKVKSIGHFLSHPTVKSLKAQGWKIPAFPKP